MFLNIMLFLHVLGVVVWMGSLLSLLAFGIMTKKQVNAGEVRKLFQRVAGAFSRWIHPSAIVVLVSGIILIANMYGSVENRPFWLDYMEMAGMTIVLVSIVVLSFVSNRLVRKPLKAEQVDIAKASKGLTTYIVLLSIFVLAIASVILFVTLKV